VQFFERFSCAGRFLVIRGYDTIGANRSGRFGLA